MTSLNQRIDAYTEIVRKGEVQAAYRGIMDSWPASRCLMTSDADIEVGGSIYQGYMDMTYFPLNTASLKNKGLKIAVVYLHDKKAFEAWLSARNRTI